MTCHCRTRLLAAGSDGGSEAGDSTLGLLESESDREQIRRELLLGHLLLLATRGGALPAHALPVVADMLQQQGLVPKWLAWTLTQQQPLFDRAFRRLFAQELQGSAGGSAAAAEGLGDDETGWAIDRFWQRRAAMVSAHSSGHLRSKSLGAGEGEHGRCLPAWLAGWVGLIAWSCRPTGWLTGWLVARCLVLPPALARASYSVPVTASGACTCSHVFLCSPAACLPLRDRLHRAQAAGEGRLWRGLRSHQPVRQLGRQPVGSICPRPAVGCPSCRSRVNTTASSHTDPCIGPSPGLPTPPLSTSAPVHSFDLPPLSLLLSRSHCSCVLLPLAPVPPASSPMGPPTTLSPSTT